MGPKIAGLYTESSSEMTTTHILVMFSIIVTAIMAPLSSVNIPTSTEFSWITCGSCPYPPEVSISNNTIVMGVANRPETGTQPRSYHGAATMLPPASQYAITFDYSLYSWDSYISLTEAGKGYWDSFSINVSSQPLWLVSPADPITPNNLPGLGFIWGGEKWGDHVLKHVNGTKTVIVQGNPSGNNYLSVVLNTQALPHTDDYYPSWGTIVIRSVESSSNLGDVRTQAASIARTVVGGQYLWGGKGWNWSDPKEYVSTQKILTDGYYYYKADVPPGQSHIVWGKGLDCSGLVYWSYNRAAGTTKYPGYPIFEEGAQGQRDRNTTPVTDNSLLPGDLLFFSDSPNGTSITHVAMYVGGNNPNQNVVEAANQTAGIVFSNKDQRKSDARFRGFGRVILHQPPLIVQTRSPVTLVVTDPDGYTINNQTYTFTGEEYIRGIPGVLYYTTDENGDDIVYAPVLKSGVYTIQVVPKPGTIPSDTFGLEVLGARKLIDLATNTPISQIPPQGYRITAGDFEINPTAHRVYITTVSKNKSFSDMQEVYEIPTPELRR